MKSLALTISGAVSLGAYEAGVLYEILHALKAHNTNPATPEDQRICIDVLTGASAGGMSATILAQKLLLSAADLDGFDSNILYQAWVEQVDLSGLLDMKPDEPPKRSLLSSNLVENISKAALTARYAAGSLPPPPVRHPAVADKLALGLALSNLNGVDYGIPTESNVAFTYTRFQDELMIVLDGSAAAIAALDSGGVWEPLRNAAVACGAFPFAFRVKELQRDAAYYRDRGAINVPDDARFAFTDGGIFHNEPLGLAKNMVDLVDSDHLSHDSRYFLLVAPEMRASATDVAFSADSADMVPTGTRLVQAIFNQARFKDWVRVEEVNGHLARFEQQAKKLREDLAAGRLPVKSLQDTTGALLAQFYPDTATRQAVLSRLAQQYAADLPSIADPEAQQAWLKSVAVLEKIAGVEEHDPMRVYSITATAKEVSGGSLCAFGGFFDQRYRHNDYELGRQKARDFLTGLATGLGPINYAFTTDPPPNVDPSLSDVQPASLDEEKREALRDQIKGRLDEILSDYGVNAIVRAPIDFLLVRPKLDTWLDL